MWQRRHVHRTPGPGPVLLYCIVLTLPLGCQPSGMDTSPLTYLDNLFSSRSAADPGPTLFSEPPPPHATQSGSPPDPLRGVDFLDLHGCTLQPTVIRRNSSLGRQAKPSQQLLLELAYLQQAPGCIALLREGQAHALAARLHQAWQLKRVHLPQLIFDATLGSEEYRAFWRVTPHPGHYPRVSDEVAASALVAVNQLVRRWLDGDYRTHNRAFELLLSEIAGGAGGVALQALIRQDGGQLLPTNHGERRYRALLLPIEALEEQLTAALPQPYRSWMNDRNQRLAKSVQR